jgi:DNA-directed RNA polymerase subunit RPC12/RpoP
VVVAGRCGNGVGGRTHSLEGSGPGDDRLSAPAGAACAFARIRDEGRMRRMGLRASDSMVRMVVRCGRCRAELEISGPGEFICPSCGTRNVVRGGAGADPFGMQQSGSGLTLPGGAPAPASKPAGPAPGVDWVTCVSCSYRFAIGPVDTVTCPNCGSQVDRPADASLPSP